MPLFKMDFHILLNLGQADNARAFWTSKSFAELSSPSTEIFEIVTDFISLSFYALMGFTPPWLKCITSVFLELRFYPIFAASSSADASIF